MLSSRLQECNMYTADICPPKPVKALSGSGLWRFWQALRAAWPMRLAPRPCGLGEPDWRTLAHLSESTLRDIGAPEWLHERNRGAPLAHLERRRW
jgi:hypothetical protein